MDFQPLDVRTLGEAWEGGGGRERRGKRGRGGGVELYRRRSTEGRVGSYGNVKNWREHHDNIVSLTR
jgi:hypothetical protein